MTAEARDDPRLVVLLDRFGRTFSDELDIPLADGTPEALFRWLTACILYGARIDAHIATRAARGIAGAGWTTAEALAASPVRERVAVLDAAHYTRYDERTAEVLGDAAAFVRETYAGDLRRLRERAGCEAKPEQQLLRAIPGLGPTGTQIFCREAQRCWGELYPFCDKKAWSAVKQLGLARSVQELAQLVPEQDFARLVAALTRAALENELDEVRRAAAACAGGPSR